jgi:predicted nucleotidyltransferase
MKRQQAIRLLAQCKTELKKRFGVSKLLLFGSTVRDTANSDSDVDILVDFDGPATSKRYFGVLFFLEDLLGCPIDLVTEKGLRPELRPHVEQEGMALLLRNPTEKKET